MSTRGRQLKLILVLTFLVVSFNNCTDSGYHWNNGVTSIGNPMTSSSYRVMKAVCDLLVKCNAGLTYVSCEMGFLATSGIGEAMGLPSATYPTYADVIAAEDQGQFSSNSASSNQCLLDIPVLSCQAPQVAAAYNPASPTPLAGVAQMLPEVGSSCTRTYLPPTTFGGLWHFEESAGATSFADSSASGNTCVCSGNCPTAGAAGISGNGLLFNGLDTLISCGTSPSLNLLQPISIEGWVYEDPAATQQYQPIISRGNSSTGEQYEFRIHYQTNLEYTFHDGTIWHDIIVPGVITKGVWQHLAVTDDGTTAILYVNGSVVNTTPTAVHLSQVTTTWIGGIGSSARVLNGRLDEVGIYNRILTPAEIQSHYLNRTAGP